MKTQGMAQDIALGDVVTIKGRKFVCEKIAFLHAMLATSMMRTAIAIMSSAEAK